MLWTLVRRWWHRRRMTNRLLHTGGQQQQIAEHRVARQRLLDEARRQRGRGNGGAHRWTDGPARPAPANQQRAALPSPDQQRSHRDG